MSELNPIENELVVNINDLKTRLKALESVRQPYLGDWIELSSSGISYNSLVAGSIAQRLNVPSDILGRLTIGDRLRYKQGGNYKYEVVMAKGATFVDISGASDYKLTNNPITNLAFSKFTLPTNFPKSFSINSTDIGLDHDGAGSITAINSVSVVMKVEGSSMNIFGLIDINISGTIFTIYGNQPYTNPLSTTDQKAVQFVNDNGGTVNAQLTTGANQFSIFNNGFSYFGPNWKAYINFYYEL